MKRIFTYKITAEYHEKRIWDFLIANGYSKHIRTYLKQHPGTVLKNEEPALFYYPLEKDDQLTIILEDEEASEKIPPVPLPLDIIYEDEDILVINKQADTPIHPSQGNYENTLANGVAYYYASQGIPFVYRCINRLDRDTTGLLILAKNMLSGAILSEQMKNREIHRTYLAIVEGCPNEQGIVDAPIGRKGESVIERQVDWEHGEKAVTHYQRLAYKTASQLSVYADVPSQGISLVKLKLETGRTHQIRVHMTSIGHPLPGDGLYNPENRMMDRQALHSYALEFVHPITKKQMCFTALLPEDMAHFFKDNYSTR
ncbi:MAG: RluA family pseudouridine synthase [Ruminococcus sp.]|nr:RluA family pseudouridine synthase [Ruminococcus sp.]